MRDLNPSKHSKTQNRKHKQNKNKAKHSILGGVFGEILKTSERGLLHAYILC
jgi:hypothetical protein